jgi:hypothetical protein
VTILQKNKTALVDQGGFSGFFNHEGLVRNGSSAQADAHFRTDKNVLSRWRALARETKRQYVNRGNMHRLGHVKGGRGRE